MSKNITIKEGGTAKTMTVNKLKTDVVGGGTCLWIPEDEVQIGTKHITQNGTYEASADNLYGYSTITVDVPGGAGGSTPGSSGTPGGIGSTIVGKDPVTGEEQAITVDENGELVTTRLPEKIAVTTQPTKTEYTDGQTINPTGIIVHAYYGDDSDYGTVLNSELLYDPIKAQHDSESGSKYSGDGITAVLINFEEYEYQSRNSAMQPLSTRTLYICKTQVGTWDGNPVYLVNRKDAVGQLFLTKYDGVVYALVYSGEFSSLNLYINREPTSNDTSEYGLRRSTSTRPGEATFSSLYAVFQSPVIASDFIPSSNVDPTTIGLGDLTPDINTQAITVKWPRIIDHKELTTTFDITVNPAQETGGETGGDEGGGGGHSF